LLSVHSALLSAHSALLSVHSGELSVHSVELFKVLGLGAVLRVRRQQRRAERAWLKTTSYALSELRRRTGSRTA
jgi:hypothetical protein